MNIKDVLANTLYQRRCSRCNAVQSDAPRGWRKHRVTNEWDVHIATMRFCPACSVDYGEWIDAPPEIPSSDTLSDTHDPKGVSCPEPQETTPNS